jgi:hypothetical protein
MSTLGARQMPAPSARARILRIGVLLGGKIVEERLIRERTPVTIGQSMRNTFSVPIEGLPHEFTLFAIDGGHYSLRFLPKMDGRLSDTGGQVNTLDALKAKTSPHQSGYYQVPLTESARGKLSFGDLTILFQFVTEPPRQPKPMLPASVRGTFADRVDPQLMVIIGISLLVHLIVAGWSYWRERDEDAGIAERAYNLTFKQDTYTIDLTQPKVEVPQNGSAAGAAPVAAPKPERGPDRPKAPDKSGDDGKSKADQVALQEQEAAKFADLLTGEGQNGTSEGDMSKRRPGAELGQQISEVREGGQAVKVGGGANRGSRDGDVRTGTGHGPVINGPGGTESAGGGKTVERGPSGRISVAEKQSFDESTLTGDAVLSKIQSAYMAGLKRCYKEYLKKDASARGKVTLSLTINATGRTVKGAAKGFAGEVDDCISALMGGWRFPIPKDKDGDPTEASFAITLQLVPD